MFYKQKSQQKRQERERKEVCAGSPAALHGLLIRCAVPGHISEHTWLTMQCMCPCVCPSTRAAGCGGDRPLRAL